MATILISQPLGLMTSGDSYSHCSFSKQCITYKTVRNILFTCAAGMITKRRRSRAIEAGLRNEIEEQILRRKRYPVK